MSYKAIKFFHDLQDTVKTKGNEICHAYNVGDKYPREGYKPSAERIAELAGSNNKRGIPLIQLVEETSAPITAATETNEETTAEVQESESSQEDEQTQEKPKKKRTTKAAAE